jgi:phosphoadenosine phosphosulfate reductase
MPGEGGVREPLQGNALLNAVSSIGEAVSPASAVGLYARATDGYPSRLGATIRLLERAAAAHPGRIVQASSLGAEDMVVTDLIAAHGLDIAVATLDTGKLHGETLGLIARIEARYGLPVEVLHPSGQALVNFVSRHGEAAMFDSIALRKACCGIRKLEPLGRMLAARTAWVTGLRREQSANRAVVPLQEEGADGRIKFSPLADWRWSDVWHYIATRDVPYNPLHDRFYPSIGCAPCTRAVAVGEDFRAGRWWWEDEGTKECGLHASGTAVAKEGSLA